MKIDCPSCKKPLRKETFMTAYMNEVFNYGGIPTTRANIIRDMQKQGFTTREIDCYQMGMALSKELKEKK